MSLYIVLFVLLIVIMIITIIVITKKETMENYSETTCVCVFDLDGTLTCGHDHASTAVNECKKRLCKFAINTARYFPGGSSGSRGSSGSDESYKLRLVNDIPLENIGLTEQDIINDIYHGEDPNKNGFSSTVEKMIEQISDIKVKHMKFIKNKYNVPEHRIILFDDVQENIDAVKKHGFGGIHANNICGINEHVKSDISRILDYDSIINR
jgi:hypothetical protein